MVFGDACPPPQNRLPYHSNNPNANLQKHKVSLTLPGKSQARAVHSPWPNQGIKTSVGEWSLTMLIGQADSFPHASQRAPTDVVVGLPRPCLKSLLLKGFVATPYMSEIRPTISSTNALRNGLATQARVVWFNELAQSCRRR